LETGKKNSAEDGTHQVEDGSKSPKAADLSHGGTQDEDSSLTMAKDEESQRSISPSKDKRLSSKSMSVDSGRTVTNDPALEGDSKSLMDGKRKEATYERYTLKDKCGFRDMDIQEIAESFRLSDIIGDGIITENEIPRVLRRIGENPRENELQDMINQVDPKGDGLFDFQLFIRLMTFFDRRIITEPEITEAFKVFDRDGGGSIESAELLHVLSSMGDTMTQEEAEGMIAEADKDGDGAVDYAEFVKTILGSQ